MKELNIGETKVRVRATPLALLFYKQEFKADLLSDLAKMEGTKKEKPIKTTKEVDETEESAINIDTVFMLQIAWATAKADAYGNSKSFPSFELWLSEFESIDFGDPSFCAALMEEVADGFLRGGKQGQIKRRQGSRAT